MAIRPDTEPTFVGRVNAADGNYPYGSSKNESAPGNNDGTPYNLTRANDVFGFLQSLLGAVGTVPNGAPDSVTNPQYLTAINTLIANSVPDISGKVNKSGDNMFGILTIDSNNRVVFGPQLSNTWLLSTNGGTSIGISSVDPVACLYIENFKNIVGLPDVPSQNSAASSKKYVDDQIAAIPSIAGEAFGVQELHDYDVDTTKRLDVALGTELLQGGTYLVNCTANIYYKKGGNTSIIINFSHRVTGGGVYTDVVFGYPFMHHTPGGGGEQFEQVTDTSSSFLITLPAGSNDFKIHTSLNTADIALIGGSWSIIKV